jgi:hypothetical protein
MSTYRRMGVLVACLGVCASIASASVTISHTGLFSGTPGSAESPFVGAVDLNKYNGDYALESVTISGMLYLKDFEAEVKNTGSVPVSGSYFYRMDASFSIAAINLNDAVRLETNTEPFSVPVEGVVTFYSDERSVPVFRYTGSIGSDYFNHFMGLGTFAISYSMTQTSFVSISGSGSAQATINAATADGWMKVDYVIPEPTTGTFWGLCGVMLVLRRRFRARR